VRGELKLDASRVGADAIRSGILTTLHFPDGTARAFTVSAVRLHQERPLIRLAGIDDASAAEKLVGARVSIARDDAPLTEGEYFDNDLIGCRVVDAASGDCGAVRAVLHYPIQDMLVIGKQKTLLPLVRAFITRVDLARKTIHISVPPGLLDPAEADEA
jgi:16S rRNA processing protein RimM